MSQELLSYMFLWKVQIEQTTGFGLGEGGKKKWQDCRDQRSNQLPAVREESRERGRGGFDGESYRKVLSYTAARPLRCEGGKDDCLFSNLTPVVIPLSIQAI